MLHLIQQTNRYKPNCILPNDDVLLLADGVYAGIENSPDYQALSAQATHLYALKPDVLARGILSKFAANIQLIDYPAFVELTVKHQRIQTW